MSESAAASAPPADRAGTGNGYDPAVVAEARKLIETTTLSQTQIGDKLGLPRSTVNTWQRAHAWLRPPGAPTQPASLWAANQARARGPGNHPDRRAQRLINRLYRACGGQIGLIETRLKKAKDALEEKDARALATLARTLQTLMALERDDGAKRTDPEAVDPDEIRARLARRLYALGQSEQ